MYFKEMMHEDEHVELLESLLQHKGSVVLSGYDSELYNQMLSGWQRVEYRERNNLGDKKTEVLWIKGGLDK